MKITTLIKTSLLAMLVVGAAVAAYQYDELNGYGASFGGSSGYTCSGNGTGGTCSCDPRAPDDSEDTCDGMDKACWQHGATQVFCSKDLKTGGTICTCGFGTSLLRMF